MTDVSLPLWAVVLLVLGGIGPFLALIGHGGIAWVAIRRFFARVSRKIEGVEAKADALAHELSGVKSSIPTVPTAEQLASKFPAVPTLQQISHAVISDVMTALEPKLKSTEDALFLRFTGWVGKQREETQRELAKRGVHVSDEDADDLVALEAAVGKKNARLLMVGERRWRQHRLKVRGERAPSSAQPAPSSSTAPAQPGKRAPPSAEVIAALKEAGVLFREDLEIVDDRGADHSRSTDAPTEETTGATEASS